MTPWYPPPEPPAKKPRGGKAEAGAQFVIGASRGTGHLLWRVGPGCTAEIVDIVVTSDRRKGTGRDMVDELKAQVTEMRRLDHTNGPTTIYALTRATNTAAHQFYEALGFRICGRLHNFYRDGGVPPEHALVYCLDM